MRRYLHEDKFFFTGAGGLDLGFKNVGHRSYMLMNLIKVYGKHLKEISQKSNTFLDKRSITEVNADEVPDCDGIIGDRHVNHGVKQAHLGE